MAAKKTKLKKKAMTLEDFAVLIQKDLARMATKDDLKHFATKDDLKTIREEMATKEDLRALRAEMATKQDLERFATKEELSDAFGTLADRIATAKEELQDQISGLKYAKEIDELRARVNVLERKMGIRSARNAA